MGVLKHIPHKEKMMRDLGLFSLKKRWLRGQGKSYYCLMGGNKES